MPRGPTGNLREAAGDTAFSLDEIDAGWEDAPRVPTSMVVPADPSRRRSGTIGALPNFRRRPRGRNANVITVGVIAFVIAGAGGYFTGRRAPVAASPAPRPVTVTPVPRPAVTTPALLPVPTASLVASAEPAASEDMSAITVLITVIPKHAVIFRGGERLGSGLVAINVEPGQKQRLTALLDGYVKAPFTVDGASDAITVRLSRVPPREAPSANTSDAPSDPPNDSAPPAAPESPPSGATAE